MVLSYARGLYRPGHRTESGVVLVEAIIVMTMMLMLVIAVYGATSLLQRSALRQADNITALSIAQGKLDELLVNDYNPPVAPFAAAPSSKVEHVTMLTSRDGDEVVTVAEVTTRLDPVFDGHVATVTVLYTNYFQPAKAEIQTLINGFSVRNR